MKTIALVGLVFAAFSGVACGGVDDGSTAAGAGQDQTSDSQDELRTGTIDGITVSRGTGFRPPPPRGQCHPSGHWAVDFTAKTISGDACVATAPVAVNRTLSTDELAKVKKALSNVRTTARPQACPTDMPVNSLTVKRGQVSTDYVDARAACGGRTPVKETGLAALVDLLETLSTPASTTQVFEGDLLRVGAAIGGESTGRVLVTDSGAFELVLDGAEVSEFVGGRKARVTGTRVDRRGVEIAMRHFIEVTDLLVCPASGTSLDCMPGPSDLPKACSNQAWIQSNCAGVSISQ